VFLLSGRNLQLGPVSDIPSKIYCHALALGVGFSHSEETLTLMHRESQVAELSPVLGWYFPET
jgi:hypothetical protein